MTPRVAALLCLLALLISLLPVPARADDSADKAAEAAEATLKAAETVATGIYTDLQKGAPGGLLASLDAAVLKQESYARLTARGIRCDRPADLPALDALFDQAFEGVGKGIAADLKGMRSEITGRWMKDGRAFVVAHGERLPQEQFTILEMAPSGDSWRLRSLAQPLSTLDPPELIIGMMVGFAERQVESSGNDVEGRIEAGVLAATLLAMLAWGASRAAPARRRRAFAIAIGLWVALLAGAWALMRVSEPAEARVRRALLALPEARVFLCLREAKFDLALNAMDEALAGRSGDLRLLAWKAYLLDHLPRKQAPPELWKALLAFPPAQIAAHYALAHIALQANDFPSADAHLTPVVEALGDDPYLQSKLLWVHARLGRDRGLELEFLGALARAYSPTPILLMRAKSYAALGRRNRAIEDLSQLAGLGTLYREMVTQDQDLVGLLEEPRLQALVEKLPSLNKD